jgi:hypothetical protein
MATSDIKHRVVVRRAAAGRKPFVWEIMHKLSDKVLQASSKSFVSLDEAHTSGLVALKKLPVWVERVEDDE